MSCHACDHISHADEAQADAKTAKQNLDPNHKPAKHVPKEEEVQEEDYKLCYLQLRTVCARHWTVKCVGCKVYLCCSGQNPVKDAIYVGSDVLGILTSGNDWNAALHIPLQAHLQDQHCMPLIAHPAGAGHCSYCPRRGRGGKGKGRRRKRRGRIRGRKRKFYASQRS